MSVYNMCGLWLVPFIVSYVVTQVVHYTAMRSITALGTSLDYSRHTFILYDLGFSLTPDWSMRRELSEALLMLLIAQGIAATLWTASLGPALAFMLLHGSLTLLRVITFLSTILPDPSGTCQDRGGKSIGGCHDLCFSGHMAAFVSGQLLCAELFGHGLASSLLFAFLIFLKGYSIVAARSHYTVDVVVALYVSVLVFMVLRPSVIGLIDSPCGPPQFMRGLLYEAA